MSIFKLHDRVQVNCGSNVYHRMTGKVVGFIKEDHEHYVQVLMDNPTYQNQVLDWDEGYLVFEEKVEEKISPYHTKPIAKGVYGEASKIFEEIAEFEDAQDQQSPVLELCELVDVIGAIEGYTKKRFNISLTELVKMVEANKRAFENGHRT